MVKDFEEMRSVLTNLMISNSELTNLEQSQKMRNIAAGKAGLENVSKKYIDLYRDFGPTGIAKK